MHRKLFFFHLPKAGGTSLLAALSRHYPPSSISPLIENDAEDHRSKRESFDTFCGYEFYGGHYGRDLFSIVDAKHVCITNFRHPVSRLNSLYRFFRSLQLPASNLNSQRFAAIQAAKHLSFRDFVLNDDQAVKLYTRNQHARQLTHSPWEWHTSIDLNRALDLLEAMPSFYVCEQPKESGAWLSKALSIHDIQDLNVNPSRPSLKELESAHDLVCETNAEDLKLYEYAVARLASVQET